MIRHIPISESVKYLFQDKNRNRIVPTRLYRSQVKLRLELMTDLLNNHLKIKAKTSVFILKIANERGEIYGNEM